MRLSEINRALKTVTVVRHWHAGHFARNPRTGKKYGALYGAEVEDQDGQRRHIFGLTKIPTGQIEVQW